MKRETTSVRRLGGRPQPPQGTVSITQWSEIIQQYPDYTDAYVQRAILLYKGGRLENAVYDLNMALKLEPTNMKAHYWRGCVYLNYGKHREALGDFRKAAAVEKGSEATFLAAFCADKLGDADGAIAMLDRALSREPAHVKALGLRGTLRVRRGLFDEALDDLTKAIQADPQNADAIAARAQVSMAKGNFGRALEDLNAALKLNPKLAQAYHDRGLIILKKRDWSAAIGELERALQNDGALTADVRYAEAYLARAMDLYRASSEDAVADFTKVERMNESLLPRPEFAEALRRRATAELEQNKLDAAVQDFERADGLMPASPTLSAHVDARYGRGVSRARHGEHDGALADLEWTIAQRGNDIQIDPAFGSSYGHRGVRRSKAGEHADAISDLTRGIALTPVDPSYREERGKCYFALGDYERAAADFEIMRRMNPAAALDAQYFAAFVHRAKARLAKGDFVGAVGDFEVATAIDAAHKNEPEYAGAYLARCRHFLSEQQWEAALQDYERAAAAKADAEAPETLHVAYCARAQARHGRGKTDHAMSDLARAIKLAPQSGEAYAMRGRIHMDRMDFADALKDLQQAVAVDAARQESLGPLIEEARQAIR